MFRGMLRPGQGFLEFTVVGRTGGITKKGRPTKGNKKDKGAIYGILSRATPLEVEQWKQNGHPISHTIVQKGTENRAKATDVMALEGTDRKFYVQKVRNPGELDHFLIYYVLEREDLQ